MKIKVGNIPEGGLELQFIRDGDWFRKVLPEKEKIDFFLHKVDGYISAKKIGKTVFLDVRVETTVDLQCCRCLETFTFPVKAKFKYTFIPIDEGIEEELELTSEDLSSGYYKDDVIELDPLIFEQVVLQIPIKPLCNDSCKGLCPHCGVNLNKADCKCQTKEIDIRFAALENYEVLKRK